MATAAIRQSISFRTVAPRLRQMRYSSAADSKSASPRSVKRGSAISLARSLARSPPLRVPARSSMMIGSVVARSEEHTSELQSQSNLVCRLLLEKKKTEYSNPIQRRAYIRLSYPERTQSHTHQVHSTP